MKHGRRGILALLLGATLVLSGLSYAETDESDPTDDADVVVEETNGEDENGTEEGTEEEEDTEEEGTEEEGTEEEGTEEEGTEEEGTEEEGIEEEGTEEEGTEEETTEEEGTEDNGDADDTDNGDGGDSEENEPVVHGVERSQEGCDGGTYRNHGEYVSSTEERPRNQAARSPCGKPVNASNKGNGKGNG